MGSIYNDTLIAGDDGSTLDGGTGNDLLVGGFNAADDMTGGTGADIFQIFDTTTDTINDFEAGTDTLNLDTLLGATFDPNNPGTDLEIQETGLGTGVFEVLVSGTSIVELNGVNSGDFIDVIYDANMAAVQIEAVGTS